MQVVLVMFRSGGEKRSFSITRDVTVVGRREDCDFRIPLGDISRKHCRLIRDGSSLRVEDLGSSNGTYCNGKRIHECEVQPGDTIQIGPVIFVAQIDGSPAEEDLKPFEPEPQPQPQAETEEEPVAEASNGEAHTATTTDDGEFDPMSVLEGNVDSDIMPALGESALNEDVMVDLSEDSSGNP
jgi:pSer/pThr/pTyr-binding forkhead associated (FHA) protein